MYTVWIFFRYRVTSIFSGLFGLVLLHGEHWDMLLWVLRALLKLLINITSAMPKYILCPFLCEICNTYETASNNVSHQLKIGKFLIWCKKRTWLFIPHGYGILSAIAMYILMNFCEYPHFIANCKFKLNSFDNLWLRKQYTWPEMNVTGDYFLLRGKFLQGIRVNFPINVNIHKNPERFQKLKNKFQTVATDVEVILEPVTEPTYWEHSRLTWRTYWYQIFRYRDS